MDCDCKEEGRDAGDRTDSGAVGQYPGGLSPFLRCPRVLAGFDSGRTVALAVAKAKRELPTPTHDGDEIVSVAGHRAVERAVLKLLRS